MFAEYAYVQPLANSYEPNFNDAYPTYLPLFCNGTYKVVTLGYDLPSFLQSVYRSYEFTVAKTNSNFVNPYSSICVNDTVYAFKITQLKGQTVHNWWVEKYGVCYYVQTRDDYKDIDSNYVFSYAQGTFMRLPSDSLSGIVGNPFQDLLPVTGSDVYFLYNLGHNLVSVSSSVYDILTYDIGGTSLATILFGGGFLLYVSWVVVKWVIPL